MIPANIREQAAELCSAKASPDGCKWMACDIAYSLGLDREAGVTAWMAWDAAFRRCGLGVDAWAEAECLLRCGWSP